MKKIFIQKGKGTPFKIPQWLKVMKLIGLFILVGSLHLSASSYSQNQKLNFSLKNSSLSEVFDIIEQQTQFSVFYKSEDVLDAKKSSYQVNGTDIQETLDIILSNTNLDYRINDKVIIVLSKKQLASEGVNVQEKRILTGVVTDDMGEPLPGVTVMIKGTTIGTITGIEGNYSLPIEGLNVVVVYSFIGFEDQEIVVGDREKLNITLMEEVTGLDEVVVVGYGTQKKQDLTGAISSVKGESLVKAPIPNLSAALGGKVTGVITTQSSGQPGYDGTNFRIRGNSTTGNNNPLIIVDGVVRPFSRIDPNDIESVTVLKDAASTAVYGARAANGVLLITTKRGKEGKPSFSYSASFGVQQQTRKTELMNAYEYAKYINEAKANYEEQLLFSDEEIAKFKSGESKSYDWLESVMSNSAPMQKHNLSVTGGNEKVNYFLGYGFLDQKGLYSTSYYKQNNIRSNIDVQLSERLKVGVDIAGRIEDRQKSPSSDLDIYQGALLARPYINPLLDEEVGPGAIASGSKGSPKGQAERSGFDNQMDYVFESNFKFDYEVPFISGMSVKGLYSFDFTTRSDKVFKHPYDCYILNEADGSYIKSTAGFSTTSLEEERRYDKQTTTQLSLHYSKKLKNHSFSSMALFEQMESNYNFLEAFRDEFITDALPELFAGGTDLWSNNGYSSETARRGYVGRIDYDYLGKYLLQANIRIDESFNFPAKGRTGVFPAFSAGWRISEESFMSGIDFISNLKLRGSWGMTGNDRVPAYQYLSSFKFDGGTVIGNGYQKGIIDTGIANPNITWETATTTDIGFDLGLFNNKIVVEFDYFYKRTEDILQANTGVVPGTFGASLPDENIGIVDSWGTEGLIRYTNRFGELFISAEANLSWYDNEAVYYSESETVLPSIAQTGRALGLRKGYLSDGLFQSQDEIDNAPTQFSNSIHNSLRPGDIRYKDINGRDENGNLTGKPDGQINADDRAIIGSSGEPNLVFGFNLNMEYKGFDLSASLQGASDFSRLIRPIPFERDGNTFKELVDSWRPGNEDAKYPRLSSGDLPANHKYDSDFWVTEVTYLRMRNLELGYNFKPFRSTFNSVGIDNVRLFLAGTNLFTISNLGWRDPEGPSSALPFYPQMKTFSIGLNVKF